ncbi:uncharacterized protein LOC125665884 [Ostrea edulis]|uniref:uncharacterized protein LOC125665884 n=1 Tax=Ostrea edulis TaxID=37623 RepID=UPI0020949924|nr:uncharacterized protein LOC125665884 [Ostrea edulis]XP_056007093.1 uncharacterized protein LOC125665884 [Ostrea edulis]XP_056007094.1 uncharacterized protein LOC125665884 [Ostrea edulis]
MKFLRVLILVLLSLHISEGIDRYYDCDVYTTSDPNPYLTLKPGYDDKICIQDFSDGLFYCKWWTCQAPPCSRDQELRSSYNKCPYCEGTCSNGGEIHDVGTSFPCADGYNTCRCAKTGVVMTSYAMTNKVALCGAPIEI